MRASHSRVLVAILLYCLCVGIRIIGVCDPTVQSDEGHWVSRSSRVATRLAEAPLHSTSHLGHPGIPSAIAMALGQIVVGRANSMFSIKSGDLIYYDSFSAARVANVLLSCLIFPLVFLGCATFFDQRVGVLATLFLALDPKHLELSRLAHIDSGMTLWITATLLTYFIAVEKSRSQYGLYLKCVAGFFWGLAIATKPTAYALIPILIAYKFLLILLGRPSRCKTERWITSSDLLSILVGHITLVSIYTRLWWHPSEYISRLRIHSTFADWVYRIGNTYQTKLFIAVIAVALLATLILRLRKSSWTSHGFVLCATLITELLILAPQVIENLIRYWTWIFSLSSVEHDGFNYVLQPHPWGYLGFFVSNIPLPTLIGILFFVLLISPKVVVSLQNRESRLQLLLLIASFGWIIPLSVTDKQSWRYALPVVPALYILAASGWIWIFKLLNAPKYCNLALAGLLFGVVAYAPISLNTHYENYISILGGSLSAAIDRGEIRPRVGTIEVIDFLINQPRGPGAPRFVATLGDAPAFQLAAKREFSKRAGAFTFGYFRPEIAHYLVVPASSRTSLGTWANIVSGPPIFTYKFKDIEIVAVWKVPPPMYSQPKTFSVTRLSRDTGKVKKTKDQREVIIASKKKHKPGDLFRTFQSLRFAPGEYRFSFPARLLNLENQSGLDEKLLSIEVSHSCRSTVFASQLSITQDSAVNLNCKFESISYGNPHIYWYGTSSIAVGPFTVERTMSTQDIIQNSN